MRRKIKLFLSVGLVSLIVINLLATVFVVNNFSGKVYAAAGDGLASTYGIPVSGGQANFTTAEVASLEWQDAAHLVLTFRNGLKATFLPQNDPDNGTPALMDQRLLSADGEGNVTYTTGDIGCPATINFDLDEDRDDDDFVMSQLRDGTLDIDFKADSTRSCEDGNEFNINTSRPELSIAYFVWIDSGTITSSDGEGAGRFTRAQEAGSNFFIRDSEAQASSCIDKLLVDPGANTLRWWELDADNGQFGGNPPGDANTESGCEYRTALNHPSEGGSLSSGMPPSNYVIEIANAQARTLPAGTGASPFGDTAIGSTSGDVNATCEASGNPFSWIICPIINGSLDGAAFLFRNFIEPMLRSDSIDTSSGSENPVYTIWKSFRTIGNIVLLFALLFIVFGQAIGGGIVDAYTAKKTLPRILVAAILINLSIYICALLIDIFNILGAGMAQLIVAPVKNAGELSIRPQFGESIVFGTTAIIGVVLAGIVAYFFASGTAGNGVEAGAGKQVLVYVLLFVVVPVILAAFGVFLTLLIRQAIILLLIVISPVAMALYAVPSADKYAKKWFDAFIKSLMVYPIITSIFGISQVLAVLTYQTGNNVIGGSIVKLIGVLIIAFAPLFMIPFAFKLAGGVIGGLASSITSGRDKLKKTWGDDKHNPHSLRNSMGPNVRHKMSHRVQSGAGNSSARLLRRFSSEETKTESAVQKAGRTAAKQAEYDARAAGETNPVKLSEQKKAAAAAAMNARKDGLSDADAAFAGSTARQLTATGSYTPAAVVAGAAAAAKARSSGLSEADSQVAASTAANLTQSKGVTHNYSDDQIKAASMGAADVSRAARAKGRTVSSAELSGAVTASVDAHKLATKNNAKPKDATAAARAAAEGFSHAFHETSGNTTVANTAAQNAGEAAARHHSTHAKSADVEVTSRAEEASLSAGRAAAVATVDGKNHESAADAAANSFLATRPQLNNPVELKNARDAAAAAGAAAP